MHRRKANTGLAGASRVSDPVGPSGSLVHAMPEISTGRQNRMSRHDDDGARVLRETYPFKPPTEVAFSFGPQSFHHPR
nr:MAG TPA: hypothetical protein [Caudoviricetes sp.]